MNGIVSIRSRIMPLPTLEDCRRVLAVTHHYDLEDYLDEVKWYLEAARVEHELQERMERDAAEDEIGNLDVGRCADCGDDYVECACHARCDHCGELCCCDELY